MYPSSPFIFSFLLLLSIPVLFFVAPRILPPKTLPPIPDPDEIDDLALFRRATLASTTADRRRQPPPPSQPKIAFLFLTNSDLTFAPLWDKFFHGHSNLFNIYVHSDPNYEFKQPLSPTFQNKFIPAKATQRASPTLISAARRLLAAALIDDASNAYFALISQTCIPLHSFRFVYRQIVNSKHVNFPRKRMSFIEILDNQEHLWNRYIARGDNVMLPEVPFEKFRVGSQFFVLSRRHALMVVRDRKLWKKFKMPCLKSREDSCYPEEHYFPTLLSMQDLKGCSKYTLTRVNWTDSVGGHPHLYKSYEISGGLIRELRKSNDSSYSYLFARKFGNDTLGPLLEIVDSVIFKD